MQQIRDIDMSDLLDSPFQGRLFSISDNLTEQDQKQIQELCLSIGQSGLAQPILVRESINQAGKFEIIDGHRRVIATKKMGETHIKAIVKLLNNKQAQLQSVISNLQRKNLSMIENAIAFEKCLKQSLFSTKADLSKAIGKDSTYVGDMINLMKMDKRIVDDLIQNKSLNDVRILRAIRNEYPIDDNTNRNDKQFELYQIAVAQNFSRQQLYKHIQILKAIEIIDQNELKIDKAKLNDTTLRQLIIQNNKTSRLKRKIGPRTINANFDLSGIDKEAKGEIVKLIENWMNQIDVKIMKIINYENN